ncbi:MAG: molybdopterin-binding protein [Nitrospirae bacterium]|nr:molybdopterin-binding protein [Nitrospirota bacterium]
MCDTLQSDLKLRSGVVAIPVADAAGTVLAHDITEIRRGEFKGRAFRKGHVVAPEDIDYLRNLGKEHLYVLKIADDEMHEDDAAHELVSALIGQNVQMDGEPKEGKIGILASEDGILKVNAEALRAFNELQDVMCATIHNNTVIKKGRMLGGARAIPLVVKKSSIQRAADFARTNYPIIEVKKMRRPNVGVVITGSEVFYGRIKDGFKPVIEQKIKSVDGNIVDILYAPDNLDKIEQSMRDLINAGADLLITTGGMSVDPDDITRFAIKNIGAKDICYGASVLPGAMFLIGYIDAASSIQIPVLGIPACGMYYKTTIFDLILPRVLAGEKIGRKEIAYYSHGGLCMTCQTCVYPHCPFGK